MRNLCITFVVIMVIGCAELFAHETSGSCFSQTTAEPSTGVSESTSSVLQDGSLINDVVVEQKHPPKLRSMQDTPPVKVTWKNNGRNLLVLRRIDFDGIEVALDNGRIPPGTTLDTQTAVGNVFVVYDSENLQGRKIHYVVPEGEFSSSNPSAIQAEQIIELSNSAEKDYRCDFRVDIAPVPPRYRFVCTSRELTGYGTLWEHTISRKAIGHFATTS